MYQCRPWYVFIMIMNRFFINLVVNVLGTIVIRFIYYCVISKRQKVGDDYDCNFERLTIIKQ